MSIIIPRGSILWFRTIVALGKRSSASLTPISESSPLPTSDAPMSCFMTRTWIAYAAPGINVCAVLPNTMLAVERASHIGEPHAWSRGVPIARPSLLEVVGEHDTDSLSTPVLRCYVVLLCVVEGELMCASLLPSLKRSCLQSQAWHTVNIVN